MHCTTSQRTQVADLVRPTARTAPRTLRASNDDRQRVLDQLQAQYVAGRLTSEELEERIERGVAARTLGDLDALVADLPDAGASSADRTSPRRSRPSSHWGHRQFGHDGEKGLRAHAISYLLVMALLVAIWALTTPGGYFWPVWPMLGWGIGLASHGLGQRLGDRQSVVGRS